jgi:endonuclease YncB( thermonuclease family)
MGIHKKHGIIFLLLTFIHCSIANADENIFTIQSVDKNLIITLTGAGGGHTIKIANILPSFHISKTIYGASEQWLLHAQQKLVGRAVRIPDGILFENRYGDNAGDIFLPEYQQYLGELLIKKGMAVYTKLPKNANLKQAYLRAERHARKNNNGLWQQRKYFYLSASQTAILKKKSYYRDFVIIHGNIHEIAYIKEKLYINFGQNWREDTTIELHDKAAKEFINHYGILGHYKNATISSRGYLRNKWGPNLRLPTISHITYLHKQNFKPR